jgi:hypothetical protein
MRASIRYVWENFKILISNPKLDFDRPDTLEESIDNILKHQKVENRFKIIVAVIGLISTIIVSFTVGLNIEKSIVASALSVLITAIAVDDALDSRKNIFEALKNKINEFDEVDLRKKYMEILMKNIENQTVVK